MRDEDDIRTWRQTREAEREQLAELLLAALSEYQPGDIGDLVTLRSVATKARLLADTTDKLLDSRGDTLRIEAAVRHLREGLDEFDAQA